MARLDVTPPPHPGPPTPPSPTQERRPTTFCPVKKQPRPWVDLEALGAYVPDPVRTVLEANEALLWTVYLYYAVNGTVKPDGGGAVVRAQELPVFRSAGKFEKRLLHQDYLWYAFGPPGRAACDAIQARQPSRAPLLTPPPRPTHTINIGTSATNSGWCRRR